MLFQLRVVRDGSAPYQLKIDATAPFDARQRAEQQGLKVLQVQPAKVSFGRKKTPFPLILFCQELSVLLLAGLSMSDVLETLMEKEENDVNQSHIKQLLRTIEEGQTLSQAMTLQPDIFPALLVATIKTAETTGNLPEALARYVQYSESVDVLKKRIVSASIYPAIVVSFGVLVFVFLMIFVIPKFSKIYESQVTDFSSSASFILTLGSLSDQYAMHVVVVCIAVLLISLWAFSMPKVRASLSQLVWQLPYLGEKVKVYHLSRLYRTFAMLLRSGITVSAGLKMVNTMLGAGLQNNLLEAKNLIGEGKSFSDAFSHSGLTTAVAIRLFKVGEKTGTLDSMMEHAASFHEEQMLRWVDKVTKIFEPVLMAIIGLLIGGLVLMMYIPIFDLASGV